MEITIQAVDPQGNAFHVLVIDSKDYAIMSRNLLNLLGFDSQSKDKCPEVLIPLTQTLHIGQTISHHTLVNMRNHIISNLKYKKAKDVFMEKGKFEKIHDFVSFLSESVSNECKWRFAE